MVAAFADPEVFVLPEGLRHPNGLTHDGNGHLYVGFVTSGHILRVAPDGASEVLFSGSDELFAGTALRYDSATRRIWVSSPDFLGSGAPRANRVALFDPDTRTVVWSATVPDDGFVNDIALDGSGGAYLTDSRLGRVYHLAGSSTDWTVVADDPRLAGKFPSAAGIAFESDLDLIVGLYADGDILRLTRDVPDAAFDVSPIALERPIKNPDGMALLDDGRLLVIEGAMGTRDGKLLLVNLERQPPARVTVIGQGLDLPVNLAVHDGRITVSESGLNHLLAGGDPGKGPSLHRLLTYSLNGDNEASITSRESE